jgi:PAS domain S-box-containing protein
MIDDERRWNNLISVLESLALGDYSSRYQVSDERDILDSVGFSINVLAEELEVQQEDLRENEERYRNLVERLGEGICVVGEEDQFTFANKAAEKIFGVAPGRLLGRTLSEFIAKKDHAVIKKQTEDRRKGVSSTYDLEIMRQNGENRNIVFSASPQIDKQGRYAIIFGVFRDITKRKRAENQYRELVEKADIAIVTDTESMQLTYFNNKFLSISGYSEEEMSNLSFRNLVHPEDLDIVVGYHKARYIGQEAPERYNFRIIRKDRKVIHLQVLVNPIYRDGHIAGTRSYIWDVTKTEQMTKELRRYRERLESIVEDRTKELEKTNMMLLDEISDHKLTEEALRQSEGLQRAILENLIDGYYCTDIEGKVITTNPSAYRMLGYESLDQILGKDLALENHIQPEDREAFNRELQEKGEIKNYEVALRRCDGVELVVEVNSRLILDEKQQPIRVEGLFRDVTERKHLQNEIFQIQKLESIGVLAGGLAHDINNVLVPITVNADLLIEDLAEDDLRRENAIEIKEAAGLAAQMTRQLLVFGRKQGLEVQSVDLNKVVYNLEKMLRRLVRENIDFVVTTPPQQLTINCDISQMEQVLINLVVNAQDAIPRDGTITIETREIQFDDGSAFFHNSIQPGSYAELALSDSGIGMDSKIASRVFEPFYTTKDREQGTGLGLALVHGVVKKHGGDVQIYSEVGHGTTVKVYLPILMEDIEIQSKSNSLPPLIGQTATVLVVEDEALVRTATCRLLKRIGHNVLSASNGQEALEIIEQHEEDIDLVLTDVVMPKMSGQDLHSRVISSSPYIRFLFMSGYSEETVVAQGLLEQNVPIIKKPFSKRQLSEMVQAVLSDNT